jgi:Type I GTP cyclohydrolase folE2
LDEGLTIADSATIVEARPLFVQDKYENLRSGIHLKTGASTRNHPGRAYDNSRFVEDRVRDIALRMKCDPRVGRFRVASENFEFIHSHSTNAEVEGMGAALFD